VYGALSIDQKVRIKRNPSSSQMKDMYANVPHEPACVCYSLALGQRAAFYFFDNNLYGILRGDADISYWSTVV
jgi:hypothetical protein